MNTPENPPRTDLPPITPINTLLGDKNPEKQVLPMFSSPLDKERLSPDAQTENWAEKLEAERHYQGHTCCIEREAKDKLYFHAGRHSAGARDKVAIKAAKTLDLI